MSSDSSRRPILFDSTVVVRLALGGYGSDFALNFFSRIESGAEDAVTDSLAVIEAYKKIVVAIASSLLRVEDYDAIVDRLSKDKALWRECTSKALRLLDYIGFLSSYGRLLVLPVTIDDLVRAMDIVREHHVGLSDAVHLAIAVRYNIPKMASFSEGIRRAAKHFGIEVLP